MRRTFPALLLLAYLCLTGCLRPSDPTARLDEVVLSDGYGPECHACNLVKLADGSLAATWFSGTKEGSDDVVIRFTRQESAGGRWLQPVTVADHQGTPCWNPVLFIDGDGRLTLFYKVAKRIPDWEGWFRTSGDGGRTWSAATRLPSGFLGPIRCHALARPDGTTLFGSSTEAATGAKPWRVHFERCARQAGFGDPAGWTRTAPPEGAPALNAIQPSIVDHGHGRLEAFVRTREGVVGRTESSDDGRTWSTLLPAEPRQANPNSGLEALRLPNGSVALVLNPGKDRRRLEVVARSSDGQAWESLVHVDETAKGEVSYPSCMIETADGRPILRVCYTRNRREIVLRSFTLPTRPAR